MKKIFRDQCSIPYVVIMLLIEPVFNSIRIKTKPKNIIKISIIFENVSF